MRPRSNIGAGLGDLVFRLALLSLPAKFRRAYATDILAFHRNRMHESERAVWTNAKLWMAAIWDVLKNGTLERARSARRAAKRDRSGSHGKLPDSPPGRRDPFRFFRPWRLVERHAFRRLIKSPRFTIVTVLTLGLGIGANTALFSVVYSVLLSPLPFENPDELVFVWETRDEGSRVSGVSLGNFASWRETTSGLEQMAAFRYSPFNVTGGDRPYRVNGLEVSAGILSLLGKEPFVGRAFTLEDERPGAEPVCMVSHSLWVDRLDASTDLRDLALTLNGRSHAVVGVLPKDFGIPPVGSRPIFTPLQLDLNHPNYWSNHNTRILGRLNDGVRLEQANSELQANAARLELAHSEWNDGIGARLIPARDQLVQQSEMAIWILFGAVGFVLLIACVNVASLMLARAALAEREYAVRAAIGATRQQIMRLVLSEALLLSLVGGVLGLALGYLGVDAIKAWGPSNLPRLAEVNVSTPVLFFALVCTIGTGLLTGLVPALRSSKADLQTTLNKSGRSHGLGATHHIQRIFVLAEVTIAVVLLNCSGLLLRTFNNMLNVDPGIDMDNRVTMQVTLPIARYSEHARVTSFFDQLHAKLDATPGILSSGSSVGLPFHWMMWRQLITLEGEPAATRQEVPVVDVSISTPGYIETMNIGTVTGRSLSESDDFASPFVAVVNEAFSRQILGGEDPIGRRLRFSLPDALLPADQSADTYPWYEVVGVVEDVRRWNLTTDATPEVFVSQRQYPGAFEYFVVAHTLLPFETVADVMREAVWNVDPEQPVAWVQPVDALYSTMVSQPRFNAVLVAAFGLTALVLALIGVYGLMANSVSARTQEIGVRIALGARPSQIWKNVAGQGIRTAIAGIGIGIAISAGTSRLMQSLLFGIQPNDVPTFIFVVATVLVVAALAASVPSWRAAKLDAIEALSTE